MSGANDNWRNFRSREVVYYSPDMEVDESDVDTLDGLIDSKYRNILKSDAESYILQYDDCALRFLRLVAAGALDFSRQESLLLVLRNLHRDCYAKKGRSAEIRYELTKTLDILALRIEVIFEKHGRKCTISDEELASDYGFHSAVRHAFDVARSAAMAAFVKGFAERFAVHDHPADMVGEWKLIVSEGIYPELLDGIEGRYAENSPLQISKLPGRSGWEIKLIAFPPLAESWYTLEELAYAAAAPIFSKALGAKVTPVGKLWD